MPGVTQPLAGVVRNVAFAKQRFDSTAGPVAKIALMLLPVATLLAYVASDRRHDHCQRERATALLRQLASRFCAAIGVSAAWGVICNWFLRRFNAANHDIAKSRSEIDGMVETLNAVFIEGGLFKRQLAPGTATDKGPSVAEEPLPRLPTAGSATGDEVGFITAKVLGNLRKKCVLYAGGNAVLLWGGANGQPQGGAPPPRAECGMLDKRTPPH